MQSKMRLGSIAAALALLVTTPALGQPFATFTATGPSLAWTNQDSYLSYRVMSLGTTFPAHTFTETGIFPAERAGGTFVALATTEYVPSATVILGNGEVTYDGYTKFVTPQYLDSYGPVVDGYVRTRTRSNSVATKTPNVFGVKTALTGTAGTFQNIPTPGNASGYTSATQVAFSFTAAKLAHYVTNVPAYLVLNAEAARVELSPYATYPIGPSQAQLLQTLTSGNFSLVLANDLTMGPRHLAAGATLLSGTFRNASISGADGGDAAMFNASSLAGAMLTFDDNDFMQFGAASNPSMALGLTAYNSTILRRYYRSALGSFEAGTLGSFSTDMAPTISDIPEPGTWALLVAGFGLVGVRARQVARQQRSKTAILL
jgi:hypothetical protein